MEVKKDISFIVKSLKKGKYEVFLEWLDLNKDKLYRMCFSYVKNNADVEDVFHNTAIKVIENIQKLKSEEAFEKWVISIMLNECRKLLREKKKVLISEEIEVSSEINVLAEQEERMDLINGLKKIDEKHKEMIILKYYSGYSQKEIAEILDIPLGTVKTKLFRGLKMLRDILGREA
ncbi:RNA polymerase sigma factor [Clostridium swellfunianum]|uniref:RNA polymerase sigma factor n=1 Tax=Clostridium swellfunianum TaxID=1367462 RepID=UPI0020305473|nr:RNA polymerase sigma factor [Clostridium swellfunianum]